MLNKMQTRHIVIKVTLNEKVYPGANGKSHQKIMRATSDNKTLTADVTVNKMSGITQSDCVAVITGLLIDDLNAMIKVNSFIADMQTPVSYIEIYAGYEIDADGFPPLIYSGAIWESSPDFNVESRSRQLTIKSYMGWETAGQAVKSISIKGKTTLTNLFQLLAANFPNTYLSLEGVEGRTVENVVFTGTALEQLQTACGDQGFSFKWDDKTLLIAPTGTPMRKQVLTISADDNLLGYPVASGITLTIRTRFNPALQFGMQINLKTSIKAYEGLWYINGLSHHLTNRDREWTSTIQLNKFSGTKGA